MPDRTLFVCVAAAVASLAAGVAAAVVESSIIGVVAGTAGVVVGVAGAALAAKLRTTTENLEASRADEERSRRDVDLLNSALDQTRDRTVRAAAVSSTFDPATGLYEQPYFAVLAQQQVAAARRSLRPLSVVIFEVDNLADVAPPVRDQALTVVGDAVRRTLRESDAACRLGSAMIGAVLEDTPETGGVWAAERVRGALLASPIGDSITVSAGVACYPTHALGAAELVAAAGRALEEARQHGSDRVEIAPEV